MPHKPLTGAFKVSEENLSFFYEALMQAPAFVAVLRGPQHVFEMANDNYANLIGRNDFIGLPAAEVVPEARGQGFFELLDGVLKSGKPFAGKEVPIALNRGEGGAPQNLFLDFIYQPIKNAEGECTGILVQGVDVTENSRLRREAEANRELMALAIDASEAGLWHWNVATGKIHWSERLEAMYGFAPNGFKGTYEEYITAIHEDDRAQVQSVVQNAIEDGQPYVIEHRVTRKSDGREVWLQGRGRAFYDDKGVLIRMSGITIDITERKEKDDLIARKSLELDRFAAIAAHDLTAPLNSITQFSELLASQYSGRLGSDADEYIDFIVSAGNRMRGLIGSLLSYARAGSVQAATFKPVSLSTVVSNVRKNLFALIAQSNAKLDFDELPIVSGDEIQLTQLFQNLISNAIKYSRTEVIPEVKIRSAATAEGYVLVIEDNGQGIAEKNLPRIFDFFSRVGARDVDGSGIGLAICKKIVEVHGGQIWVESEFGVGSKFHFTLSK